MKSNSKHFWCSIKKAGNLAVVGLILPSIISAEEGVHAASTRLGTFFNCPITDSIIDSWIIALLLILICRCAIRGGPKIIPSAGQSIIESILQGLKSMIEPITGPRAFALTFPLLLGYFFFIFSQNIGGLIPGIGSIGISVDGTFKPFLRPGTADMNTTLALALIAFVAWFYYCYRCTGIRGLYEETFGNKADRNDLSKGMFTLLTCVFFAVGFVECISILCRIISLSCRLFGNTFGGENLLHNMYHFAFVLQNVPVVRYLSYLLPLPFYLLELLVAIIQASVFTLLVSVYIGLVCNHDDHADVKQLSEG